MSFESFVDNCYPEFAGVIREFDKTTMPGISKAGGTVWSAASGGNAVIGDHRVYADGTLAFKSIPLASNDPTNLSLLVGRPMFKGNVVVNP